MVAVLSDFDIIWDHTYSKIKVTVLEYLRNQEFNSNSDQGHLHQMAVRGNSVGRSTTCVLVKSANSKHSDDNIFLRIRYPDVRQMTTTLSNYSSTSDS